MKGTPSNRLAATFVALIVMLGTALPAHAGNADLISMLTDQLGVTQEQAEGGAGSIFAMAKDQLSADDFATLAGKIPGIDSLISAAPAAGGGTGGASSFLSGAASAVGAGDLGKLADQFSALGLTADDVQKFVPIVLDYAEKLGGADTLNLLQGALPI